MNPLNTILAKYPIRNRAWSVGTNVVVTETSDLSQGGRIVGLDPWNRHMPQLGQWEPFYTDDHEISHWMTSTTVEGKRVGLVIFND